MSGTWHWHQICMIPFKTMSGT
ncbi:hypothetical protein F383_29468 [Gossypium arboreum]|uniref:Uncharacterized protein n=1 Tax=Gossypium arboreum TaxID=29729 RepID=A0A0B0MZC0_GOSAR|nr:hypothetical protein F383_29468 [Gossypium arboreum]